MPSRLREILKQVRLRELRFETAEPVAPDTPVREVHTVLDRQRRNAVVVCDADRVVGIFTQRDVLYSTALENPDPATPIRELMTAEPFTLRPDDRLADAIRAMTERGYRNVPLVDEDGRWVGLVSGRCVLAYIAEHFPEAVLNLPPRLHQTLARPDGG